MTKYCVLYMKDGKEKRSAWFSSRARAHQAREIIAANYGAALVYVD